ncbi:MAG: peptidylprolyl isomerase, partial [Planctomycetota bacterium]
MTTQGRFRGVWVVAVVAAVAMPACVPLTEVAVVTGPEPSSNLSVTASTDTPQVGAGAPVILSATATGGTPPYRFHWDKNAGPEEFELGEDVTSSALTIDSLEPEGRYVFRVVVTDDNGLHDTDFIVVEVGPAMTVTAETSTLQVFEGTAATLTAGVEGGTEPFTYEWGLDSGPVELDLSEATSETLTTETLTAVGEYVFVVTVTDTGGVEATAQITVEVVPVVSASVPECAIIGEPVTLSATLAPQGDEPTMLWEVISGPASIADETAMETTLTTTEVGPVDLRLTVTLAGDDESPETTTLDFALESVDVEGPRVLIETNFGAFTLELEDEAAPLHVENFLAYVDEGFYDGLLFHRSACIPDDVSGECLPFVLQGGGFQRVEGELEEREPTRDPVESEADNGLSNGEVYSISLAVVGSDPNSGTTQLFINLADNSFLDEQGFTVFGRVIEGTDVVDDIAAMERTDSPILPGEVSLPVEDVIME